MAALKSLSVLLASLVAVTAMRIVMPKNPMTTETIGELEPEAMMEMKMPGEPLDSPHDTSEEVVTPRFTFSFGGPSHEVVAEEQVPKEWIRASGIHPETSRYYYGDGDGAHSQHAVLFDAANDEGFPQGPVVLNEPQDTIIQEELSPEGPDGWMTLEEILHKNNMDVNGPQDITPLENLSPNGPDGWVTLEESLKGDAIDGNGPQDTFLLEQHSPGSLRGWFTSRKTIQGSTTGVHGPQDTAPPGNLSPDDSYGWVTLERRLQDKDEDCEDGILDATQPGCLDSEGSAHAHGEAWMQGSDPDQEGFCVRRVTACVSGQLVQPVNDTTHLCDAQLNGNQACQLESFFSCCPLYDCRAKLASLISPETTHHTNLANPRLQDFLGRINISELYDPAPEILPVAQPRLTSAAISSILESLHQRPLPLSTPEQKIQHELQQILNTINAAATLSTSSTRPPSTPPASTFPQLPGVPGKEDLLTLIESLRHRLQPGWVPPGVRTLLGTLNTFTPERRTAVWRTLRHLLTRVDSGQLSHPLTRKQLMDYLRYSIQGGEVSLPSEGDIAALDDFFREVQKASSPHLTVDQILRYIVSFLQTQDNSEQSPTDSQQSSGSDTLGLEWTSWFGSLGGVLDRMFKGLPINNGGLPGMRPPFVTTFVVNATHPRTETVPDPASSSIDQLTVGNPCSNEGQVWARMTPPRTDTCWRGVVACYEGRVVTSGALAGHAEHCQPPSRADLEPCRLQTFFSCCPVYDCRKKRIQLVQAVGEGSSLVKSFDQKISSEAWNSAVDTWPVVDLVLNVTTVTNMYTTLMDNAPQQTPLREELEQILRLFGRSFPATATGETTITSTAAAATPTTSAVTRARILTLDELMNLMDALAPRLQQASFVVDSGVATDLLDVRFTLETLLRDVSIGKMSVQFPENFHQHLLGLLASLKRGSDFQLSPDVVSILKAMVVEHKALSNSDLLKLMEEVIKAIYHRLLILEPEPETTTVEFVTVASTSATEFTTNTATGDLPTSLQILFDQLFGSKFPSTKVNVTISGDSFKPGELDIQLASTLTTLLGKVRQTQDPSSVGVRELLLRFIGQLKQNPEEIYNPVTYHFIVVLLKELENLRSASVPEVQLLLTELLEILSGMDESGNPQITKFLRDTINGVSSVHEPTADILKLVIFLLERTVQPGRPTIDGRIFTDVIFQFIESSTESATTPQGEVDITIDGTNDQFDSPNDSIRRLLITLTQRLPQTQYKITPDIRRLFTWLTHLLGQEKKTPSSEDKQLVVHLVKQLARSQDSFAPSVNAFLIQLLKSLSWPIDQTYPGEMQFFLSFLNKKQHLTFPTSELVKLVLAVINDTNASSKTAPTGFQDILISWLGQLPTSLTGNVGTTTSTDGPEEAIQNELTTLLVTLLQRLRETEDVSGADVRKHFLELVKLIRQSPDITSPTIQPFIVFLVEHLQRANNRPTPEGRDFLVELLQKLVSADQPNSPDLKTFLIQILRKPQRNQISETDLAGLVLKLFEFLPQNSSPDSNQNFLNVLIRLFGGRNVVPEAQDGKVNVTVNKEKHPVDRNPNLLTVLVELLGHLDRQQSTTDDDFEMLIQRLVELIQQGQDPTSTDISPILITIMRKLGRTQITRVPQFDQLLVELLQTLIPSGMLDRPDKSQLFIRFLTDFENNRVPKEDLLRLVLWLLERPHGAHFDYSGFENFLTELLGVASAGSSSGEANVTATEGQQQSTLDEEMLSLIFTLTRHLQDPSPSRESDGGIILVQLTRLVEHAPYVSDEVSLALASLLEIIQDKTAVLPNIRPFLVNILELLLRSGHFAASNDRDILKQFGTGNNVNSISDSRLIELVLKLLYNRFPHSSTTEASTNNATVTSVAAGDSISVLLELARRLGRSHDTTRPAVRQLFSRLIFLLKRQPQDIHSSTVRPLLVLLLQYIDIGHEPFAPEVHRLLVTLTQAMENDKRLSAPEVQRFLVQFAPKMQTEKLVKIVLKLLEMLSYGEDTQKEPSGVQTIFIRLLGGLPGSYIGGTNPIFPEGTFNPKSPDERFLSVLITLLQRIALSNETRIPEVNGLLFELTQLLPGTSPSELSPMLLLLIEQLRKTQGVTGQEMRNFLVKLLRRLGETDLAASPRILGVLLRFIDDDAVKNVPDDDLLRILLLLLERRQDVENPKDVFPQIEDILFKIFGSSASIPKPRTQGINVSISGEQEPATHHEVWLTQLLNFLRDLDEPQFSAGSDLVRFLIEETRVLSQTPDSSMPSMHPLILLLQNSFSQGETASVAGIKRGLIELLMTLIAENQTLSPEERRILVNVTLAGQERTTPNPGLLKLLMLLLQQPRPRSERPQVQFNITTTADNHERDNVPIQEILEFLLTRLNPGADSPGLNSFNISRVLPSDEPGTLAEIRELLLTVLSDFEPKPIKPIFFNISATIPHDTRENFTDVINIFQTILAQLETRSEHPRPTADFNISAFFPQEIGPELNDIRHMLEHIFSQMDKNHRSNYPDFINITKVLTVPGEDSSFDDLTRLIMVVMSLLNSTESMSHHPVVSISAILANETSMDNMDAADILKILLRNVVNTYEHPKSPKLFNISGGVNDQTTPVSRRFRDFLNLIVSHINKEIRPTIPYFGNIISVLLNKEGNGPQYLHEIVEFIASELDGQKLPNISVTGGSQNSWGSARRLWKALLGGPRPEDLAPSYGVRVNFSDIFNDVSPFDQLDNKGIEYILEAISDEMKKMISNQDQHGNALLEMLVQYLTFQDWREKLFGNDVMSNFPMTFFQPESKLSLQDFRELIGSLPISNADIRFQENLRRLMLFLDDSRMTEMTPNDLLQTVLQLFPLIEASGNSSKITLPMLIEFLIRQINYVAVKSDVLLDRLRRLLFVIELQAAFLRPPSSAGGFQLNITYPWVGAGTDVPIAADVTSTNSYGFNFTLPFDFSDAGIDVIKGGSSRGKSLFNITNIFGFGAEPSNTAGSEEFYNISIVYPREEVHFKRPAAPPPAITAWVSSSNITEADPSHNSRLIHVPAQAANSGDNITWILELLKSEENKPQTEIGETVFLSAPTPPPQPSAGGSGFVVSTDLRTKSLHEEEGDLISLLVQLEKEQNAPLLEVLPSVLQTLKLILIRESSEAQKYLPFVSTVLQQLLQRQVPQPGNIIIPQILFQLNDQEQTLQQHNILQILPQLEKLLLLEEQRKSSNSGISVSFHDNGGRNQADRGLLNLFNQFVSVKLDRVEDDRSDALTTTPVDASIGMSKELVNEVLVLENLASSRNKELRLTDYLPQIIRVLELSIKQDVQNSIEPGLLSLITGTIASILQQNQDQSRNHQFVSQILEILQEQNINPRAVALQSVLPLLKLLLSAEASAAQRPTPPRLDTTLTSPATISDQRGREPTVEVIEISSNVQDALLRLQDAGNHNWSLPDFLPEMIDLLELVVSEDEPLQDFYTIQSIFYVVTSLLERESVISPSSQHSVIVPQLIAFLRSSENNDNLIGGLRDLLPMLRLLRIVEQGGAAQIPVQDLLGYFINRGTTQDIPSHLKGWVRFFSGGNRNTSGNIEVLSPSGESNNLQLVAPTPPDDLSLHDLIKMLGIDMDEFTSSSNSVSNSFDKDSRFITLLVSLLRSQAGSNDDFLRREDVHNIIRLLSGYEEDWSAVPAESYRLFLRLLHATRIDPSANQQELYEHLKNFVLLPLQSSSTSTPELRAVYCRILTLLMGGREPLPRASETALYGAVMLLLSGPSGSPGGDSEGAVRVLLHLLMARPEPPTPAVVDSDIVPDALLELLAMVASRPKDSQVREDVYRQLMSFVGKADDFLPSLIPDSFCNALTLFLNDETFDTAAIPDEIYQNLLSGLLGRKGFVTSESPAVTSSRLVRRLLLLLAGRGVGAAASPGELLRRCQLLCDAAVTGRGRSGRILAALGASPLRARLGAGMTFIGENHVVVVKN